MSVSIRQKVLVRFSRLDGSIHRGRQKKKRIQLHGYSTNSWNKSVYLSLVVFFFYEDVIKAEEKDKRSFPQKNKT